MPFDEFGALAHDPSLFQVKIVKNVFSDIFSSVLINNFPIESFYFFSYFF